MKLLNIRQKVRIHAERIYAKGGAKSSHTSIEQEAAGKNKKYEYRIVSLILASGADYHDRNTAAAFILKYTYDKAMK